MKYIDIRSSIKSGDVLAWTSHNKVRSWYDFKILLVRIFTQSEYTHVGIVWVVHNRVFILEAVSSGIRIFPLSLELPFFLLPWKELTDQQLEFALSKAGQKYSYWECVKAYFGRNNRSDSSWQCAEFVSAVHNLPCDATPSAVVSYLLNEGSSLTKVIKDV